MDLLERDTAKTILDTALEAALSGAGRVVVVSGEAGIGKTSVVQAFAERVGGRIRLLTGVCDPLLTPRPLGPLRDIARQTGGEVADRLAVGDPPERVFHAFVTMLLGPLARSVIVVEDAHWADDATLDWLAHIGRRLAQLPVLLVLTCRDDERDAMARLGRVLTALPHERVQRLHLEPLSAQAVRQLAGPGAAARADAVHATTGGNPLFVTELLAADARELPASVRDAVLARVAQAPAAARPALDAVAVVPLRTEWWLLDRLLEPALEPVEAALASGLLVEDAEGLAFRHELTRQVAEHAMSLPRRRSLHRRIIEILEARDDVDPARLAHHAREAGDPAAVLVYAASAGRVAAASGAHREAHLQLMAAARYASRLPAADHAALLEDLGVEAHLINHSDEAVLALERAVELRREEGAVEPLAEALRRLADVRWWAVDRAGAEAAAHEAVQLLEPLGGPPLARAYVTLAHLSCQASRATEGATYAALAAELARTHDDDVTYALATVYGGVACSMLDLEDGVQRLSEAFRRADRAGLDGEAAGAATERARALLGSYDLDRAGQALADALAYARDHDLPAWEQYLLGLRADWALLRGDWEAATRDALDMVARGDRAGISLCPAMMTLGVLQVRRGDPDAAATLDEALERSNRTGEVQRLAPTYMARAEHAWLSGDLAATAREARAGLELALPVGDPWLVGGLLTWLVAARQNPPPGAAAVPLAAPFQRLFRGDAAGAARLWEERGMPYEQALALGSSDDPVHVREAIEIVDRLGATATGRVLRERLRALGVRHIPRGPTEATRIHPAGLTPRQAEVLALLGEGLTNAEIAARLYCSVRTVDHHVSAVLTKLGVSSRQEAAAAAVQLGMLPHQRATAATIG